VTSALNGAPLGSVDIRPRYPDRGCCIASARTDANGSYSIDLPNATYRIQFVPDPNSGYAPRYWQSGIREDEGRDLIVSNAGVSGIDISLETGFRISGVVTRQGSGARVDRAPIWIGKPPTGSGSFVIEQSSDSTGTYQIRLPSGTYRLTFYQPHPSGGCCHPGQLSGTDVEVTVSGRDITLSGSVP